MRIHFWIMHIHFWIMRIHFWIMCICSANAYLQWFFFMTPNGFFMTRKSDPHYLNLTLRTLSEHNCALNKQYIQNKAKT